MIILRNSSPLVAETVVKNLSTDSYTTAGNLNDVCLTAGCRSTASLLLQSMDDTVDPCEDFYRYVCGGFLRETIIPEEEFQVDRFNSLRYKVRDRLKKKFAAKSRLDEPKAFRLVKNMYKSCVNTTAIEAKGVESLRKRLKSLGGWPLLEGDSWNADKFDWIDSMGKLRDAGFAFDCFIKFSVEPDVRNTTKRIIYLNRPPERRSREYLIQELRDPLVFANYTDYMSDTAVILGADKNTARKELGEALNLEIALAKADDRSSNSTITTLGALERKNPKIKWKKLFQKLLPSSITVDENEPVILRIPESYIIELERLLTLIPKRVQVNYVMWNAVTDSVKYLNDDTRKKDPLDNKFDDGRTRLPPRPDKCFRQVSVDFKLSAASMYVRQYFDEDARGTAADMVMTIKDQIAQMLQEADWMDEKSKQDAIKKVAAIKNSGGYPPELLDDKKLESYFKNLELSEDNYFENSLNLSRFATDFSFSQLREPVDPTDWRQRVSMPPASVHYDAGLDSIKLTPDMLRDNVFFGNDRPRYMDYGGLGSVVAHEIARGLEANVFAFSKTRDPTNQRDALNKENFDKRMSCVRDQYSNYTVQQVHSNVDGERTLSENIADHGRMKAAYRAYNSWAAKNLPEQKLPGFDKSPKQMFWISSANVLCSKMRPEAMKKFLATSIYSPDEFRVLGPLSNMPEFAQDFQCPEASKMIAKNRCIVW